MDLTYEEFVEFTSTLRCHYCQSEVTWAEFNVDKHGNNYNLDRKDHTKTYSKDNCVVCCARCNWGKQDQFSYDEWYGMTAYLRRG